MSDEKPSITAVWTALGGDEPHRSVGWVKVKCILHPDRTASATINEDAGRVNCFTCLDRPIDSYELVQRVEGVTDFAEAKRRAEEISAGRSSSTLRGVDDSAGPRLLRGSRDQRDRRAYRPTWRMP